MRCVYTHTHTHIYIYEKINRNARKKTDSQGEKEIDKIFYNCKL